MATTTSRSEMSATITRLPPHWQAKTSTRAVREWTKLAAIDAGKGPPGAQTMAEREELVRLRRDNNRLEMETARDEANAFLIGKGSMVR